VEARGHLPSLPPSPLNPALLLMLVAGCGGTISGFRGFITVRQQADTDCAWLLSAPVGSQITVRAVRLAFLLTCRRGRSYVEVMGLLQLRFVLESYSNRARIAIVIGP